MARAPTKVTLFGEHAVVYGYPALVISIPVYVTVSGSPSTRFSLRSGPVHLHELSITIENEKLYISPQSRDLLLKYFSYVIEATKLLGVKGLELSIESELPVGAGLGTSAAVTVGTIAVGAKISNKDLTKEEIAKIAWKVEERVQGKASPMDTFASALGGALLVRKSGDQWSIERIRVGELPLVVGVFRKRRSTAQLVEMVAKKMSELEVTKSILKLIGEITENALKALETGDLALLGELMNVNHGLLEALGLVNKEVACAVHSLRKAGALGVKMSGAGHGGAVIALGDDLSSLESVLRSCGAEKTFIVKSLSKGVEYPT